MIKTAKIYVAGHRGMVGSAIVRGLKAQGYSNLITCTHAELDLTRQADVDLFFEREKPEYVFLAAAKVGGILANNTYKADFIYENIMIASNVIYAAYKNNVKKLLNLGSSCIYPKYASQPMSEDALLTGTLEPTNEPYAVAKISAIKLCRYFNEQYGTNFISGMPTNLYGPNDNYNLETSHVLPAMIRKCYLAKLLMNGDIDAIKADFTTYGTSIENDIRGLTEDDVLSVLSRYGIFDKKVTFWGSGSPYREFLYSDDLAAACIFLMQQVDAKDSGEFVNIGSGVDLSIRDLAGIVMEVVGYKGEIVWDSSKPDGTPKKLLNVERINNLGWKAKIGLNDGVTLAYKDYTETISKACG